MLRPVGLINYKTSFGSRNNPVEPFNIKTSKGTLYVREYRAHDFRDSNKMYGLSKLLVDNFVEGSTDPEWKQLLASRDRTEYLDQIDAFMDANRRIFVSDDGNTTFLVAKDVKKRPRAAIIMSRYNEINGLDDSSTGYVESLVVDKKYRGLNIGQTLFKKVEQSAKGVFSDIFLEAFNRAKPFYEGVGFKELDLTNPKIKAVSEKIMEYRDDAPKFITFMSKPLDEKAERWFERLFKRI